ncbi:MAG: HAD family hydrolase [Deltaproteobacteria bacterium]|nr:MAG: HAD family hydrolase [Deltaproteobacteria bacterium]
MRPTVLLFDIDGTLVITGGAGRRSMARAFEEVTGEADVFTDFRFGGMTDLGILRAGLERVGRLFDMDTIEEIFAAYLSILPDEVAKAEGYRVLPGVEAVLEAVFEVTEVAVGLGTGNVEAGGRIKLRRAGLSERFAFGGFGSDAEERVALLRRGAERGAGRLGADLAACRVVIIGDTPRDVLAAEGMGADCVAVGTGGHSLDELRAAGPGEVFQDLEVPGVIDAILAR